MSIRYREGYKYQLAEDYAVTLNLRPDEDLTHHWFTLTDTGLLTVRAGYAWDGPSGPTKDTPDSMRGSLVHDVLYQAMREGLLDPATYREPADLEMWRLMREDGMWQWRAYLWWRAVRRYAETAATVARQILTAP